MLYGLSLSRSALHDSGGRHQSANCRRFRLVYSWKERLRNRGGGLITAQVRIILVRQGLCGPTLDALGLMQTNVVINKPSRCLRAGPL